MADLSDKMNDMSDMAKDMKDSVQERMEAKMHNDDRERSANEE
jgi:hypothetical protein